VKAILKDSIAFIVTLLGLLGLIWSFHLGPVIVATLSLSVVAFGVTIIVSKYLQSKRPEFTIKELTKELKLLDKGGHLAALKRTMVATSNLNGLKEVWYRNIAADGQIEHITINGEAAAPGNVIKQLGLIHLRIPLAVALTEGQEMSNEVTYDLIDSFVRESEALIHIVNYKTRKAHLRIEFPEGRTFKKATMTEIYGGAKPNILRTLANQNQSNTLDWEIEEPKLGGSYELRWEW
jgi:hypothetical protein